MIYLTAQTQIEVAVKPADFRKQIDGLVALIKQHLERNPRSGALYVFINRARTMIRILSYQDNGYWIVTKRLSKGRFEHWPSAEGPLSAVTAKRLNNLIKNSSGLVKSEINC